MVRVEIEGRVSEECEAREKRERTQSTVAVDNCENEGECQSKRLRLQSVPPPRGTLSNTSLDFGGIHFRYWRRHPTVMTRVCDCDCQSLAGQQSTVNGARRPPAVRPGG
eukprot:scaffold317549_cov36-Cyclotella_meneghiniana.AAC.1